MWRPKWLSRGRDTVSLPTGDIPDAPSWVTYFRLWGVPMAAVAVLVLCAPGEQHIAELSGWHGWISWGLAGLFTLYAGLAAVISTQLPKGARGKGSSIVGAVVSLALAMGAQPVSHMFVTGYLTAEPRPPLWLVATVSCIPPFILGHLLHFAAMPTGQRHRRVPVVTEDVPEAVPQSRGTSSGHRATVTPIRPPAAVPAVQVTVPRVSASVSPAAVPVSLVKAPSRPALSPAAVPAVSPGTSRPPMGTRALELLQGGTPEDEVKRTLRTEYASPDGTPPKTNTIRKSITRAQDKLSPRP